MPLTPEPLLAVLLRAGAVLTDSFGAKPRKTSSVPQTLLLVMATVLTSVASILALVAFWRTVELSDGSVWGTVWAPLAVGGILLGLGLALVGGAWLYRPRSIPIAIPPAPLETLLQNLPPCLQQLALDPHLRLLVLSFLSGALAAKRPD